MKMMHSMTNWVYGNRAKWYKASVLTILTLTAVVMFFVGIITIVDIIGGKIFALILIGTYVAIVVVFIFFFIYINVLGG